jgi:hypothetical protein
MLMGVDHRVERGRPRRRAAARACRAGVDQHPRRARRPSRRSTSIEQRRRRLRGFAGSQAPQCPPSRGTPPEEPQPRMVTRSSAAAPPRAIRRPASPAPRRPWRTAGRSSPWSPRRSLGSMPDLRPHAAVAPCRPARCACRGGAAARGRARRSRPAAGRAARGEDRAQLVRFREGRDPRHRQVEAEPQRRSASAAPEEKQCITQRRPRPRAPRSRMRAMSASASRAWMISGRPVRRAASMWRRRLSCCARGALGGVVVVEPGLADAHQLRDARRAPRAPRPSPSAPRRRCIGWVPAA